MDISFKIDQQDLERIIRDNLLSEENLRGAMGKACALVEAQAKMTAPKGSSGQLATSIESEVKVSTDGATGRIFTNLEYAPYVEHGTGLFAEGGDGTKEVPWVYYNEEAKQFFTTSGQHPQPFMRPALYDNEEKILKIIGRELVK